MEADRWKRELLLMIVRSLLSCGAFDTKLHMPLLALEQHRLRQLVLLG